jgi:hypothetical protein
MRCQRQEGIVEDFLKVHNGLVGLVEVVEGKRRKNKWVMIKMNVFHKIYLYLLCVGSRRSVGTIECKIKYSIKPRRRGMSYIHKKKEG